MENNKYYISLTRGLIGYYVLVLATDEYVAREYASNYFDHNWCSVYDEDSIERIKSKYKTIIINEDNPVVLGDTGTYE